MGTISKQATKQLGSDLFFLRFFKLGIVFSKPFMLEGRGGID